MWWGSGFPGPCSPGAFTRCAPVAKGRVSQEQSTNWEFRRNGLLGNTKQTRLLGDDGGRDNRLSFEKIARLLPAKSLVIVLLGEEKHLSNGWVAPWLLVVVSQVHVLKQGLAQCGLRSKSGPITFFLQSRTKNRIYINKWFEKQQKKRNSYMWKSQIIQSSVSIRNKVYWRPIGQSFKYAVWQLSLYSDRDE